MACNGFLQVNYIWTSDGGVGGSPDIALSSPVQRSPDSQKQATGRKMGQTNMLPQKHVDSAWGSVPNLRVQRRLAVAYSN